MSLMLVLTLVVIYFGAPLLGGAGGGFSLRISRITSKGANMGAFFRTNLQSPWYLVALGTIGAAISGITLISTRSQKAYRQ